MKCGDVDAVLDRIDTKMGDSVSSVTSITSVDDAKAKRTPHVVVRQHKRIKLQPRRRRMWS